MKPIVLSAHFPDQREAKEVKRAAKLAGESPSAFIREAAKQRAREALHCCPTCGAKIDAA